jgi:hypothetical protein
MRRRRRFIFEWSQPNILLFHEPLLRFLMHRRVKNGGGKMGGDLWGTMEEKETPASRRMCSSRQTRTGRCWERTASRASFVCYALASCFVYFFILSVRVTIYRTLTSEVSLLSRYLYFCFCGGLFREKFLLLQHFKTQQICFVYIVAVKNIRFENQFLDSLYR